MLKLYVVVSLCVVAHAAQLQEVFRWKDLEFAWPSDRIKQEAIQSRNYISANNLPLGLARWRDKLFVTVPRWKAGVASSLNYISLNTTNRSPVVIPYPDLKANTLPKNGEKLEDNHIISTFRVHVDECDRLWVMDTGVDDILGEFNQYSKSALVVFDLNTNKLIRRYEFKATDQTENSFFANLIVDVQPSRCEDAFAYVPDLGGYGIVVYSWKNHESWRVKHNYFHFDPLKGDLTVGGVNFQWTDGVFGLALGRVRNNGYRTLYFHPLVSTNEFSVSTEVLRNQSLATSPSSFNLYKIEGNRGPATQASASSFDLVTEVVFLTQLQKDGIACWNVNKPLTPENFGVVAQDKEGLIFPNDLKIDADRNLWVLSDRMPVFLFHELNPNEYNYRIYRIRVDEAIWNTPCAN
ncbi:hypothetical protein RN001_011769 [Aquatica leii]|uniref:Protein yellow n=1 Tax=Aquatica leii TaxID=1421715 RepID=A0AAN7PTC3_9COLE|nr:hypothetical protein RN001_011769 [Aquatica leii]